MVITAIYTPGVKYLFKYLNDIRLINQGVNKYFLLCEGNIYSVGILNDLPLH